MQVENDNVENVGAGTTPKRSLGITKEVASKAGIPIPAPYKLDKRTEIFTNGFHFPIVQLVNVVFDPVKEVNRGGVPTPTPVLSFIFKMKEGNQYTHSEFPVDDEDAKFEDKLATLQQRVKHIFDEVVGAVNFVEGSMNGSTFAELFGNIEKAFKAKTFTKGEGDAAKTLALFSQTPCYLKLVYYKDRLQVPLYPNFIERAMNGAVPLKCNLAINPSYDKLEPVAKATNTSAYTGGTNNSFGGGFGDDDFPEIP